MQDEIHFNVDNGMGVITLNRPAALNALNIEMLNALHQQLLLWEKNKAILSILIQSSTPGIFCAGGDIKAVYQAHQNKVPDIAQYFKKEYELNQYIFHYAKPYIAFLDGLTMGGGAGVSLHGKLRIATEKFSFAMPETSIGYFPDVGTSYILSRLPNEIGIYLALTSMRINATEANDIGLIDIDTSNGAQENHLKKIATQIATHFKYNTVEEIFESLVHDKQEWAQQTLATLKQKSPTSLKLTLKLLRQTKSLDFDQCIALEYKLASYFCESHDFYEGIRAAVIDKDRNPRWNPNSLDKVDPAILDLI
ncbi:MAG: enoyl-CoA hydratase/isomerase family protein [Gammaproteobacteria bacterium]|nr:enoyl-CoA hydratase/isomerase family protein [Gammaproteobacteria bacterium]